MYKRQIQLIDDKVSVIKKTYKDVSDKTLKLEDKGGNDDLEMISNHAQSPRKVAYYRYNHVFLIED